MAARLNPVNEKIKNFLALKSCLLVYKADKSTSREINRQAGSLSDDSVELLCFLVFDNQVLYSQCVVPVFSDLL